MIEITDKSGNISVYFPKNQISSGTSFTVELHSELSDNGYTFNVTDQSTGQSFYLFTINFSGVTDGEYNYFVKDGDEILSTGLIRIGDVTPGTSGDSNLVIQYTDPNYTPVRLQTKQVSISENGQTTVTADSNYVGLKKVEINTNVTGEYNRGYSEGYAAGVAEQKAKLSVLNVSQNGQFKRADGYKEVNIAVPVEINNQIKRITGDTNDMTYSISADSWLGYTGLERVSFYVNVPMPEGTVHIALGNPELLNTQAGFTYTDGGIDRGYNFYKQSYDFKTQAGNRFTITPKPVSGYETPAAITGVVVKNETLTYTITYQPE